MKPLLIRVLLNFYSLCSQVYQHYKALFLASKFLKTNLRLKIINKNLMFPRLMILSKQMSAVVIIDVYILNYNFSNFWADYFRWKVCNLSAAAYYEEWDQLKPTSLVSELIKQLIIFHNETSRRWQYRGKQCNQISYISTKGN